MEPSRETTEVWVALNVVQRGIYRIIDSKLKSEGLPPLRWYDVLWELEKADDAGLRYFELEYLMVFEQSNLSKLVRRIIEKGYVNEYRDSKDGRGKILKINSRGCNIRKKMWVFYGPLIQQHVGILSEKHDVGAVAEALKSLMRPEFRKPL